MEARMCLCVFMCLGAPTDGIRSSREGQDLPCFPECIYSSSTWTEKTNWAWGQIARCSCCLNRAAVLNLEDKETSSSPALHTFWGLSGSFPGSQGSLLSLYHHKICAFNPRTCKFTFSLITLYSYLDFFFPDHYPGNSQDEMILFWG